MDKNKEIVDELVRDLTAAPTSGLTKSRAKDYINLHPNCLHLWKPIKVDLPKPPSILIGF